ncbi:TonB-dependent vitamin B12 receptor [Dyella tabacisoli]|uniref:TonB-dependent vitamin B12 receptor n=1 Tax=Dyella tabacisoli TaxID=2282381 RepID=A0A369UJZ8_9GAMM|nr:TonB-dependent vitamin B12 receptor [Dyella tabacisoli]RDD80856.1 TonB-dependent vitamin B12 receptor [Dyella tabacisoli]
MKKTLLATALLSCTMAAYAADPNTTALPTVLVTATRTAITTDEALASVTVITREDIERLQPVSVTDLLIGLPGVTVAQAGGLGQQTSMFLRGTNSTHTLVLIDGVRVGNVNFDLPAYEQIPVDQIERIELVRGPRSSLYGSDAIGGVIQIFTKRGQRDGGLTPSLRVSTGSNHYVDGQVGLAGGDTHAWYNLSLDGQYTRGINACRVGAAEAGAGCFVDEPDRDGMRNWNGAFSGGYRWDNGTELTASWLRSKTDIKSDGSPAAGNLVQNEQDVAGAHLSFSPLDIWKVTLGVGQNRDRSNRFYQGYYAGDFFNAAGYYAHVPAGYVNSRRNQASWQNDISLATNQLLTVGVDWQQEHIASDTAYLSTKRDDTGGYAQYLGTFGRNEVQLSVRRDHNEQFGNHTTGGASWGYGFDHGLRLTASWGSAFHAPTFNDLYYPYGGGNPNLKPEKSHSTELGLSQKLDSWNWALNAYQTQINQLITLDSNYYPMNISKARINGLEAQLGTTLDGWQVQGYLTLQQPKNRDGGANDGNLLARRPQRTARIDLDRRFGDIGIGATFNAAGKRYDDLANVHRLGGYATTDLRASYTFAADWQVEARLANAFDRRYETVYYFNQPGRTWFLTVRYSPSLR